MMGALPFKAVLLYLHRKRCQPLKKKAPSKAKQEEEKKKSDTNDSIQKKKKAVNSGDIMRHRFHSGVIPSASKTTDVKPP